MGFKKIPAIELDITPTDINFEPPLCFFRKTFVKLKKFSSGALSLVELDHKADAEQVEGILYLLVILGKPLNGSMRVLPFPVLVVAKAMKEKITQILAVANHVLEVNDGSRYFIANYVFSALTNPFISFSLFFISESQLLAVRWRILLAVLSVHDEVSKNNFLTISISSNVLKRTLISL